MRLPLTLLLLVFAGACAPQAPSGAALEALSRPFVQGEDHVCLEDDDCQSRVCAWGTCAGLTSADRAWMTEAIADAWATTLVEAGGQPALAGTVLAPLLRATDELPPLRRARLLRGWARLDPQGAAAAARALDAPDLPPILAFEAARVRLAAGERAAGAALVDAIRRHGPELLPFVVPLWGFFATPERTAILEALRAAGDEALAARLEARE